MTESTGEPVNDKAQAKADKAYKKASRPWFKKKRFWALGIIGLLVISSVAGGGETSSDSETGSSASSSENVAPEPALKVSARTLLDALESNALSAKTQYKDKRVVITGTLSNIDASGKYFSLDAGEISFINIQVFVDEEFIPTVSGFSKGQQVTVTGKIKDVGELLGYQVDAESIP
jgi:hypothetical protein